MITARPRGERGVHQAGCGPREPGCHLKGSGSATPNACAWFNPVSGFRAQPNGLYPKPSPTNAQRSTTSGGPFSEFGTSSKWVQASAMFRTASSAQLEVHVRTATSQDALAFARIYAAFVTGTAVSFEENPPDEPEMRHRILAALDTMPWLTATNGGEVAGFAYASRHRERASYRWAVDVSAYVAEGFRGQGVATRLYGVLLGVLAAQGFRRAHGGGITLPNEASSSFHRAMGFETRRRLPSRRMEAGRVARRRVALACTG